MAGVGSEHVSLPHAMALPARSIIKIAECVPASRRHGGKQRFSQAVSLINARKVPGALPLFHDIACKVLQWSWSGTFVGVQITFCTAQGM